MTSAPQSARRGARLPVGLVAAWRWPAGDKLGFAAAFPLMLAAAALLRLAPIRRLARLLGAPLGAVGYAPLTNPSQERRARLVRRSIRRAARASPLRSDCLPQALAAVFLCRCLGVPVATHLGVRLGESAPMEAHAWLCSGRVAVAGGDAFGRFAAVSCFLAGR